MRLTLCGLLIAVLPASALAADLEAKEAQRAQLEALRTEVAGQLQLQAYDLLDELVFGWLGEPPFALQTPVVLADVSVPVGFSSGLQALIENHFTTLLIKNPSTHLTLSHCPECTSLVVHSGSKGTIVSRGVDQPEALSAAGKISGSRHAIFLDFEVEGAALVLRARITALEPNLPIVYAKTLSTLTTSAAMLRHPERLKSAEGARQEYLDALEGRGIFLVPIRIGVRTYNPRSDSLRVTPFVWLSFGIEASLSQARAWTAGVSFGLSWAPELHVAWEAQARIARLVSGSTVSLTRPDLYVFVGGGVISVYGQEALAFRNRIPTIEDLELIFKRPGEPNYTFGTIQLGLELRVKNRVGVVLFVESAPGINDSEAIGKYWDLGPLSIHTLGIEVSFCF
ncbi:MAG: hypothetical protein H6Q89_1051 [Myxococcaceae bacterium]|nr:hypothetical protein [Myxococcaceae bacterium]